MREKLIKKRIENQVKCLRDVKKRKYERSLYFIRKWKMVTGDF